MNCDCIEKVDARLAEAGRDYKVAPSIVFNSKMEAEVRLAIDTCWTDPPKRTRKKPPPILCTFCPFCGIRAGQPNMDTQATACAEGAATTR